MMTTFRNRDEAAAYVRDKGLPCSKLTLQKWATTGGGPEYRKFGNRVVYTVESLDRWIESKLGAPQFSTSKAA